MHLDRYQAKLTSRPLLTQVITTAVLFGTGDVIAQQAVEKKGIEKHDAARTGRMVLYGGGQYTKSACDSWGGGIPTGDGTSALAEALTSLLVPLLSPRSNSGEHTH